MLSAFRRKSSFLSFCQYWEMKNKSMVPSSKKLIKTIDMLT